MCGIGVGDYVSLTSWSRGPNEFGVVLDVSQIRVYDDRGVASGSISQCLIGIGDTVGWFCLGDLKRVTQEEYVVAVVLES
jgi:hypothetical protein